MAECDVRINRGILTGCNDAFIIDGATKDRLIAEDPKSAEIIRPILRGRDIKRYGLVHNDTWLISTHNGFRNGEKHEKPIAISDYPAVKKHLDAYWSQIEKRADQGVTPYNLRNCAYWDDFSKQKIVWGNLCLNAQFAIAEAGYVINAPSPLITPGDPWLLAFLNSAIADFYIRTLGVTRNGGYFEYKPMFVERLPVPYFTDEEKRELESLANKQCEGTDVSKRIDLMIAGVIGLDDSERSFLHL